MLQFAFLNVRRLRVAGRRLSGMGVVTCSGGDQCRKGWRAGLTSLLLTAAGEASAQSNCAFSAPVQPVSGGTYAFVTPLQWSVVLSVNCRGRSPVGTVTLNSSGGQRLADGAYSGFLFKGPDKLRYDVVTQLSGTTINLAFTVPAWQWDASSGAYSDTLTITFTY